MDPKKNTKKVSFKAHTKKGTNAPLPPGVVIVIDAGHQRAVIDGNRHGHCMCPAPSVRVGTKIEARKIRKAQIVFGWFGIDLLCRWRTGGRIPAEVGDSITVRVEPFTFRGNAVRMRRTLGKVLKIDSSDPC